jgi:alpha-galactosidase
MAWSADVPGSTGKYVAVFNMRNPTGSDAGVEVPVSLHDLGFQGKVKVRDLWSRSDAGTAETTFDPTIPWHGAGIYRLSP